MNIAALAGLSLWEPTGTGTHTGWIALSTRRERTIKVYKNPHTGEVVETKGGNHKVLKAWKAEYGSATVEAWLSA